MRRKVERYKSMLLFYTIQILIVHEALNVFVLLSDYTIKHPLIFCVISVLLMSVSSNFVLKYDDLSRKPTYLLLSIFVITCLFDAFIIYNILWIELKSLLT